MSLTQATFDDFKVGDTLAVAGTALLPAGDWVTNQPTGWLVDKTGNKMADLAVTLEALGSPTAEATHSISIELDATNCARLAAGCYSTDIRFRDVDGVILHSPTFVFDLKAAKTGVPA